MFPLSICNYVKLFSFIFKIYICFFFLKQFFSLEQYLKWSCLSETWPLTILIDGIQRDWNAEIQMGNTRQQKLSFLYSTCHALSLNVLLASHTRKKTFMTRKAHVLKNRAGWKDTDILHWERQRSTQTR